MNVKELKEAIDGLDDDVQVFVTTVNTDADYAIEVYDNVGVAQGYSLNRAGESYVAMLSVQELDTTGMDKALFIGYLKV